MKSTSGPRPISVFWFRRDLRVEDNRGFFEALNSGLPVLPIFIFDPGILDGLSQRKDARVEFIMEHLNLLHSRFVAEKSGLKVFFCPPQEAFEEIRKRFTLKKIFFNQDYEPYAEKRDQQVPQWAQGHGIEVQSFKDQVVFEKDEIVKSDGTPYVVYTPYSKAWKMRLKATKSEALKSFASESHLAQLLKYKASGKNLKLEEIGFVPSGLDFPDKKISKGILENYAQSRDFPAVEGTTRLGVHLRFGTLSIRQVVLRALDFPLTWLSELIWREFFMMILWHHPRTVSEPFRREYAGIEWNNHQEQFQLWCEGKTGYPLVDAGMRELNQTGYMHNRVRMLVASFLTKHLLIDWRWGERYFAEKLLDFELSSNVGNWQWAAGCGCDAAPYFRVFNPDLQQKKFDPEGEYVRAWVDVHDPSYPKEPIVEHTWARNRALKVYKAGIESERIKA